MPTNPLGPNTKNLTANLPIELYLKVESLAYQSGFKPAEYARALLNFAAQNQLLIRRNFEDEIARRTALVAQKPEPPVRLEVVAFHAIDIPILRSHPHESARVAEDPPSPSQAPARRAKAR